MAHFLLSDFNFLTCVGCLFKPQSKKPVLKIQDSCLFQAIISVKAIK